LQKHPPYWRVVRLHAVDTGVDLDADDRFQILAPDRVVAVHRVAEVFPVRAFHPVRVTGHAVDVARAGLFQQVADRLAVAVDQPAGKVVLKGRPEPGVAVL
jgi:hypothetical protein